MTQGLLHDWTLLSVQFDWNAASVKIQLEDSTFVERTLVAEGVKELFVPKRSAWGPSVSVDNVTEIELPSEALRCVEIEMQSGDVIRVVAERVLLPIE